MADLPTFSDLERVARDEALSRNSHLTREIVEREGSDANAILAAAPAVGDEIVGQLARSLADLYGDTARDAGLERLWWNLYRIVRKGAAPALTEVTWSTTAPNPGAFVIPVGSQVRTSDGKAFITTSQATFPQDATSLAGVPVQSRLAGLSQHVRIGAINQFSPISGAPSDLAVTNPVASSGADDIEAIDDFRSRGQLYYTTAARGVLPAIVRGALAVPGVRRAVAFEALSSSGEPARIVELVIADAFTDQLVDSSTVPATYQTQSNTLRARVKSELREWRAGGIQVFITIAVVRILGVSLLYRFRSDADQEATKAAAVGAIVGYTNGLSAGQTWSRDEAHQVLAGVQGLVVLGGEVVTPAGDVVPSPLEVFRTSTDYVVGAVS